MGTCVLQINRLFFAVVIRHLSGLLELSVWLPILVRCCHWLSAATHGLSILGFLCRLFGHFLITNAHCLLYLLKATEMETIFHFNDDHDEISCLSRAFSLLFQYISTIPFEGIAEIYWCDRHAFGPCFSSKNCVSSLKYQPLFMLAVACTCTLICIPWFTWI